MAGRLRYRQILISMGRQNGKSILGAIFGVYGLLFHEYAPKVVGVAYSAQTATVVYNRVSYTINNVPQFKKVCKVTKVSGIRRKDAPGEYIIKPNSEKAIQGFPITLCIYDEVHITSEKLWSAAKQGTKTKKDGLVLGITTAGDDNSELLKNLYKQGERAIAGDDERFGFFCWEAPEGSTLDDDDAIKAANPAVACGRIPVQRVRTDAQTDPEPEQQRYVLNRFVSSSSSWMPMHYWLRAAGGGVKVGDGQLIFSIDRSAEYAFASIVVSQKSATDGKVRSQVIWSWNNTNDEQLLRKCLELRKFNPVFVMDNRNLGGLAKELKSRGFKTYAYSAGEIMNACGTTYGLVVQNRVEHPNQETLRMQMPRAVRKNVGDSWVISRAQSSIEIDAVMATVMGIDRASREKGETVQLF